ncbi:tetratricopeptide repeat protein [Ancylomarina sp. 16SWW S1-10-2]|uniref:tetratricopeptide repeat protein n=1 Tax=Ancylomarina sp. 16SWW S1-10-2 TaxID=2499681 RepID=UPI00189CBFD0|nr:tetratricopeptide repeat protein [Ancylomarina sp. 16SWW S1-10-2]
MLKRQSIVYVLVGVLMFSSSVSFAQKRGTDKKKNKVELTEQKRLEFDYAFHEGEKALGLGEYEKAISWFANCLKLDTTSAVVYYELANIYISQENFNSALELARSAVALQPKNIWYQVQLAGIFKAKGMIDQACEVYENLAVQFPERDDFRLIQAELFISVEKFEEALEVYQTIEKKLGVTEDVSINKHTLYLRLNKRKNAYAELNKLIKKFPFKIETYGLLADMYLQDGNKEKALEQYKKIVEIAPENGLVHFYLAEYYRKEKQKEMAQSHLEKAFSSNMVSSDKKIQYLVGVVLADTQNPLSDENLKTLLDLLMKVHPDDIHVNLIYADYLRRQKDSVGARKLLRKVLLQEKNTYAIWEELMFIDNELLDFDSMFTESAEAIKYFPTQPLLYVFNGVAAAQKKDFETAVKTLTIGFNYVGNNLALRIQFLTYLGDSQYELGNIKKAFEAYDEVLLFEPANVVVLNNYSYYLSVLNQNLEKAKEMSLKCVQIEKENSTYLDTHAWVLFKLGSFSDAKIAMEKSLQFGGRESAVIVEHYGDILYRLGEKEAAMAEWKNAEKIGEGSKQLLDKIKTGIISE